MYIILEQKVNKNSDEIRTPPARKSLRAPFASASYAQLLSVYL